MSSFRENIRLANALVVVLLSGRSSTEISSADLGADQVAGTRDGAHLSLVVTGTYRTPRRSHP